MIRVARNGMEVGRFTPDELWRKIQTKEVLLTDDYWQDGMSGWQKVAGLPKPAPKADVAPKPPLTNQPNLPEAPLTPKSKTSLLTKRWVKSAIQLLILWVVFFLFYEACLATFLNIESHTYSGLWAWRSYFDGIKAIDPLHIYRTHGRYFSFIYLMALVLLVPLLRLVQDFGKPEAKKPSEYWTRFFG